MMKAIILVGLLSLAACSGGASDSAGNNQTPTALVSLGHVDQGVVTQSVTLYGVTEAGPLGRLTMAAPAEAVVARIVAPAGTNVARGQLLAQLAPSPTTRVAIAKAATDASAADQAYARAKRLRADGLVADSDVESAHAAAQSADAMRASLEKQAKALTLRAPASGVVDTVSVGPGDLLQTGATVLTLARPGDLRGHFGADPAVVRALRVGSPVKIDMAAGRPAMTVAIQSINPVVDPQTRLASVYTKIPANSGLGIGETMTARVGIGTSNNALTIPYAALLDDGGQPYVFVVSGGVAHRHDVTTGPVSGERIAITKGVKPGEMVVTAGGTAVQDGMKVRTK